MLSAAIEGRTEQKASNAKTAKTRRATHASEERAIEHEAEM
jgi:hypothetical protein